MLRIRRKKSGGRPVGMAGAVGQRVWILWPHDIWRIPSDQNLRRMLRGPSWATEGEAGQPLESAHPILVATLSCVVFGKTHGGDLPVGSCRTVSARALSPPWHTEVLKSYMRLATRRENRTCVGGGIRRRNSAISRDVPFVESHSHYVSSLGWRGRRVIPFFEHLYSELPSLNRPPTGFYPLRKGHNLDVIAALFQPASR